MLRSKDTPVVIAVGFVALIVVIGGIGFFFLADTFKYNSYDSTTDNNFIDPTAYQAVFLTNDQIYFGHLKDINSDYLILSDVYYVKVNEEGDGQIIKLGVIEPHGPQDKMVINQDHVLYWENLRQSSQVVETINKLKNLESQ